MSAKKTLSNLTKQVLAPPQKSVYVTMLGKNPAKVPESISWRRMSGQQKRLRFVGPYDKIVLLGRDLENVALDYNISHEGGKGTLVCTVLDRDTDIETWESIPIREEKPLSQHPRYAAANIGWVDAMARSNDIVNPRTGIPYGFGDSLLNEYRDFLIAGKGRFVSYRHNIRQTISTANSSTATASTINQGKRVTVAAIGLPPGLPFDTTGTHYLKGAPQVQFAGGLYQITIDYESGDWPAGLYDP